MKITKETALKILQGEVSIFEEEKFGKFTVSNNVYYYILYQERIDSIRNKPIYVIETFYLNV